MSLLPIEQINALPEAAGWWPTGLNDRIVRLIRAVERKHLEAEASFRVAVIDQLVIHHIYNASHDSDPRKALTDLLQINQDIALDPAVSSAAQALIERGRAEAGQDSQRLEKLTSKLDWDGYGYWFPDRCVKFEQVDHVPPPTLDELRAFIDKLP